MWIWQLIIRRAKKVTIPLTKKNCTPFAAFLTQKGWDFFSHCLELWPWTCADVSISMVSNGNALF